MPAKIKFYPYYREGMAARIEDSEVPHSIPRASSNIKTRAKLVIKVKGIQQDMDIYGPGDVLGIDERQIIRTEPPALSNNFETTFRPYIEFDRPDFPWIFTPLKSNSNKTLIPWICLIVLRKDAIISLKSGSTASPLQLTCPSSELPNLAKEAPYLAHAQYHGEEDIGSTGADSTQSLSRLVAYQNGNLEPETAYHAFVVPVFNVGKEAGLKKENISSNLDWAWRNDSSTPETLPVYYSWEFSTSESGNFRSLAERLKPWVVPNDFGTFKMKVAGDESEPGQGRELVFAGALVSPSYKPGLWWPQEDDKHCTDFKKLLAAENNNFPVPEYGKWHAKTDPNNPEAPQWLKQLNFDPRLRVAAGLGAKVIKNNQESLMKGAWEQIEDVGDANILLRQAQLAREVNQTAVNRGKGLSDVELIQFSAIAHPVIRAASGESIQKEVEKSQEGSHLTSSVFQRFSRFGNLQRRKLGQDFIHNHLGNKRDFEARTVTNTYRPDGMVTIATVVGADLDKDAPADYMAFGTLLNRVEVDNPLSPNLGLISQFIMNKKKRMPEKELKELQRGQVRMRGGAFNIESKVKPKVSLNTKNVASRIIESMNSTENINRFSKEKISFENVNRPLDNDALAPIMAGPEFNEPVYDDLSVIKDNLLMPGAEGVPRNSISLLSCNDAFVNAFMVGLNFEMARELLWRGYPTDQRGTYFMNFWPKYSLLDHDIKPISKWKGTIDRPDEREKGSGCDAVFLIRGELLQRYPGLAVSLVPGKMRADKREPDLGDNKEELPIFAGKIGNGLHIFGFDVKAKKLLSKTDSEHDEVKPGWYLLLEEQATEIQFKLIEASTTENKHAYYNKAHPTRLYIHVDSLFNSSKKGSDDA